MVYCRRPPLKRRERIWILRWRCSWPHSAKRKYVYSQGHNSKISKRRNFEFFAALTISILNPVPYDREHNEQEIERWQFDSSKYKDDVLSLQYNRAYWRWRLTESAIVLVPVLASVILTAPSRWRYGNICVSFACSLMEECSGGFSVRRCFPWKNTKNNVVQHIGCIAPYAVAKRKPR